MSNTKCANSATIASPMCCPIQRAIAKNNNTMLIDTLFAPSKADTRTAEGYLKKQRERAAVENLPQFEQETKDDIALLRQETAQLHSLIVITNWLLMIAIVLGAMLWML